MALSVGDSAVGISGGSSRESSCSTMKTLYDLLGALPDDDAEDLRTAFRQAAKATHPDATDDPDAPLKFRQIVRANTILSDADQRATYDRLLALTRRQSKDKSKRTIRKFAFDAIKVACLSALSIGGYLVFEQVSKASIVPVRATEVTARARTEVVAVTPTKQIDTTGRDTPPDKPESAGVASEPIVPSAAPPAAPAATTDSPQAIANAGPAPELTAGDAKSYRERGIVAYLGGDLYRALADFDVAIQIDPGFADAYIDRGIVFYRIHEFDRAFADIAQAKRIKSWGRTRPAPLASRKASSSSAKN
jgi:tetratricopeptide (TPR) repeat protein